MVEEGRELRKSKLGRIGNRSAAVVWTLMFWSLMDAPATLFAQRDQKRHYTMATNDQIKTALLTEHFRYTPLVRMRHHSLPLAKALTPLQTLLDDIINTVNELVYQAVGEIETALLNVPKEQLGFTSSAPTQFPDTADHSDASEEAAATEIGAGVVKLQTLLDSTIDKNFDKLEIYTLRNLLTVSNAKEDEGLENWIVLDHYKVCFSFSSSCACIG